ncbi:sugar transferase [Leptothrix cholodnii SP-6]|uniref:Sugar transferase n=1 Tax=Leptothrix cholodnii (strain ATCC 51168 / LMG 8142 / SP-6) TaxID=395495 RepID=B1XW48_LEPCP|nr:sugar transferase [Leptothrix cholodnii]ACB32575.1 sugar transferase [Leptothrix cholodnii SP-6]
MVKRLFDLAVASLALLLLAPLLAGVAIAVKLDTPGPVFYRQVRVGRGGREFRIHKFRTMTHDPADRGPQLTVGADARITRVGAFLRHSKWDELAQLIDVWRGDMSIVGPRPEVPRYVALYPADLREQVLSVRPGITDDCSLDFRDEGTLLAQSADPERTYVDQILPIKLRLQARYVAQAGVRTDLRILARTFAVLAGRVTR